MAITGAAAIGAIAAGTVGGISATTLLVAGLAITAVGYITDSALLKKIGGGLAIGSGAMGVGAGAGAAEGAAGAADAGMAAPSVADVAGAGSQAAGNVAEATVGAATDVSSAAASVADTAGVGANTFGFSTGLSPMTEGAAAQFSTGALDAGAQGLGDAAVSTANSGIPGQSINDIIAQQSPNAQSLGQSSGAANTNAANAFTPNANPANSIDANTSAASSVAPGNQAAGGYGGTADGTSASGGPAASSGSAGGGSASGAADSGQLGPQGFGGQGGQAFNMTSQDPTDFWNQTMQKLSDTWGNMDKYTKNGIFQTGAGLMQGLGQGALSMMSESQKQKLLQQQQDYEHANMSGAAMPTVGFKPSTTNPYRTNAAGTFQGARPAVGLINTAKG